MGSQHTESETHNMQNKVSRLHTPLANDVSEIQTVRLKKDSLPINKQAAGLPSQLTLSSCLLLSTVQSNQGASATTGRRRTACRFPLV